MRRTNSSSNRPRSPTSCGISTTRTARPGRSSASFVPSPRNGNTMRYEKGHGQQTRSRIVENASYGLRQSGADGMSVVELMKLVGLTHGGFYSHFQSREALFVEAFVSAMDQT